MRYASDWLRLVLGKFPTKRDFIHLEDYQTKPNHPSPIRSRESDQSIGNCLDGSTCWFGPVSLGHLDHLSLSEFK